MKNQQLLVKLRSLTEKAMQDGALHGCVIVAGNSKGQEIKWSWGNKSVSPKVTPMDLDSVFDIASVTKAVATASSCAACIDKGLLVPDAPASDYLPGLVQPADGIIRVCDLASHYSGYSNRKFDNFNPETFFDIVIKAPCENTPGTQFEYSCRNFILLGLIAEKVSGKRLDEFCKKNIFAPLGMDKTDFGPVKSKLETIVPTNLPAGIISDNQARKAGISVGNAGLFSTGGDLAIFAQMMLNKGTLNGNIIFNKTSFDWLTKPCNPEGLPPRSFGYDMTPPAVSTTGRPKHLSPSAYGHSGWTGQCIWIDPELDFFYIVLTNRTHAMTVDNYELSRQYRIQVGDLLLQELR
jgi:CubicO group peptidase (beta-lactamase class C family)